MTKESEKRIIVTGGAGQLGRALAGCNFPGAEIVCLDRRQCDIGNREQVEQVLNQFRPYAVVNAAAYTAVDGAESEPDRAYRSNVEGVRNIAEASRAAGARLVHVSTDYVFDGTASTPYAPDSTPSPVGVYGSSKLEGERAFVATDVEGVIVRTAWLYSEVGKNFVTTILAMIRSGKDLRIISDQIGTPTSASELATILLRCALDPSLKGIVHWTNAGSDSWYGFALAINQLARERSITRNDVQITPISTDDYPAAARRPAYSVLDSSLLWSIYGPPNHWREALARVLDRVSGRNNPKAGD